MLAAAVYLPPRPRAKYHDFKSAVQAAYRIAHFDVGNFAIFPFRFIFAAIGRQAYWGNFTDYAGFSAGDIFIIISCPYHASRFSFRAFALATASSPRAHFILGRSEAYIWGQIARRTY